MIPEAEDPRQELAALTALVAEAVRAAMGVGAREEDALAALPASVEEQQEAAPAPTPPAADAWAAAAASARARAVPLWQGPPAEGRGEALERVRAELGDCRRCGLCAGRRNIVFGVGDAEADLMVIGEGPGEQEDLRGEPFVGPAGEMLDNMLTRVLDLPRERVYIANVVKCRPPDNRNPSPDEVAACLPFLHRQIEAVRPKLLLVLGSVALQHVLGISGITRNRGRELAWRDVPAIPTFHPAYLLRQPGDKRLTFEDLKVVRRRYDELGGRR